MARYSRRGFLGAVALGLVSYAGLSQVTRGGDKDALLFDASRYHNQPTSVPAASAPIPYPVLPNSRGGTVVSVNGNDLLVTNDYEPPFTLRLTTDTVYDEGSWTGTIAIEAGDSVIAQTHQNAGVSVAESIWTNVTKVEGEVIEVIGGPVAPFRIHMRNGRDILDDPAVYEAGHIVLVDPRTGVAIIRDAALSPVRRLPAGQDPIAIAPGDHLLVVGRQQPDATVLAASVLFEGV